MEISTSLLDAKSDNINKIIYDLEAAKTDYFHIDVMDGKFVKNDTTNKMREYTETLTGITTIPIEVHLMVEDVKSYVDAYMLLKPSTIIFNIEPVKEDKAIEIIRDIKEAGIKVGIAINPKTDITKIFDYLPYLNRVLVMGVEAGEGGQKMIEDKTIQKVSDLNRYIYENEYEALIEVDGGVNDKNSEKLKEAGVDILVVGQYIINSDNYKEAIKNLK